MTYLHSRCLSISGRGLSPRGSKSAGQRLPDRGPRLQGIGHDISHAQELMDHARIDLQIDGNAGGAQPCRIVAPLIHQGIIFGKHDERRRQP